MATAGKVIGIGNLKGGVGKSTLAINLGCALAERGMRVLVIDTDPQQTSTLWTRRSRLACFVEPRPIRNLAAVGEWLQALANARGHYSCVILDLPAVLSPALAMAFLAADLMLIPTTLSTVDLEATRRTLRHAQAAIAERASRPPHLLVVPTLMRRRWFSRVRMPAELQALNVPIGPAIRQDPAFIQAFAQSDWIGGLAPRSGGARDLTRLAMAVETLLEEVPSAPALEDRREAAAAPATDGPRDLALTGA